MKKKIVSLCLVVAMVAVAAIGGTLAYFTDKDNATNTFTVGNVKIELLESKYHRMNPDSHLGHGGLPYNTKVADDVIIADAADYQDWLKENGAGIMPGQWVSKNTYVRNIGANDAYVRIRVLLPAEMDDYLYIMETTTAQNEGAILKTEVNENVSVGDKLYVEYVYTYTKALAPEEITYWNAIGAVRLAPEVDEKTLGEIKENGFSILVEADAIQAESFIDGNGNGTAADEAFAAFDNEVIKKDAS